MSIVRTPEAAQTGPDGTRSLTGLAHDALRRDIVSGARAPGERLRIERLKQIYGIGPTPLREALQRLVAGGLVIALDNRGFMVAPLDPAEFADLNLARTIVETNAVRLAIARGDGEWESRVAGAAWRLAKADAALKAGTAGPDDSWEAANDAFHRAILDACGSRALLEAREALNLKCERYRRASVALKRNERDLVGEHRAIAEAVLARDAETASRLVAAHFDLTTRILVAELDGGYDAKGPSP